MQVSKTGELRKIVSLLSAVFSKIYFCPKMLFRCLKIMRRQRILSLPSLRRKIRHDSGLYWKYAGSLLAKSKMAAIPRAPSRFASQLFSFISRRLSVVAAQSDSIQTQTGIPVIVAHHTIKKAFTVHPKSRAFQPSLKHQWLTKTILTGGLPEGVGDQNTSCEDMKTAVQVFQDSFMQQLAYQKQLKKKKTRFDVEMKLGIFHNLLRICYGISMQSPGFQDSFLDVSPKIHTHWVRNHEFYNLIYRPDLILWSSIPNDIYEQDIQSTMDKSLPGPYDPYSQALFQHPIVHLRNFPGYQSKDGNTYQNCHTLFLADVSNQTAEQMHSYGIMGMFGLLASKAISNGVLIGQHLPTPLTTKCVISNGKEVVLMCYQLNTLSLQEDHGIKNCAWCTDKMQFFNVDLSAEDEEAVKRSRKLYGSFGTSKDLPSVHHDCVQQVLSFISQ